MATLVSDILSDALYYIFAYAPGDIISPEDESLALRICNRLLDSLSAKKLSILGLKNPQITLSGAASYLFGAYPIAITAATQAASAVLSVANTAGMYVGGPLIVQGVLQTGWNGLYTITALVANTSVTVNLNSTALTAVAGGTPIAQGCQTMKIKSASVLAANGVEQEAGVIPFEEYVAIPDKTRTGIYIEDVAWDRGYPQGTLYVTPKPAAGTLSLWVYVQYAQFGNYSDTVILPPGFERPLVLMLALEMCVPWGRPVPEQLPQLAVEALQTIAALQTEILGMSPPQNPNAPPMQPTAPGANAAPAR